MNDGNAFDQDTSLSPFTWRYGTDDLRRSWGEVQKRQISQSVQSPVGLVSQAHVGDALQRARTVSQQLRSLVGSPEPS
jgi:hypothetical protein